MNNYLEQIQTKKLLVGKENKPRNFKIKIKGVEIGKKFLVIAGPCAAENEKQVLATARGVKRSGADIFRAGMFKPRTSPYSFQGMGEKGIEFLRLVKKETDLPIVSEVMNIEQVNLLSSFVDIFQIGARNMYNYPLLSELGRQPKPVLLKRGFSATLEEFLLSAEYIALGGNKKIILCERGVRTFIDHARFTLDLAAVPILKSLTFLPIIIDPSHAAGRRELVEPLSLAAVACGADGLMVEVHYRPKEALSDREQLLSLPQFQCLLRKINRQLELKWNG